MCYYFFVDAEGTAERVYGFLQQCELFSTLDERVLRSIAGQYPWHVREHSGGALLAQPGDAVSHLIGIARGSVAAELVEPGGSVVLIESLNAGAVAAGPLLFASQPVLPVQLRALEQSVVVKLDRASFLRLLASNAGILENVLRESADKIAFLAEKLRLAQFSSLTEKAARWFLRQANLQNREDAPTLPVTLPCTQEMLANLFGVTRPALSRCLGRMERDGVLRRHARREYLVYPSRLKRAIKG